MNNVIMMLANEETKLIQSLRSRYPEKRQHATKALSRLKTKKAVEALIHMANGERRSMFHNYSLDDQLMAIQCLGDSGTVKALDFLEILYTPQVYVERREEWSMSGSGEWDSYSVECHHYPNAYGPLAKALYYEVYITTSSWGSESYRAIDKIEKDREEVPKQRPEHKVICTAIYKLRGTLEGGLPTAMKTIRMCPYCGQLDSIEPVSRVYIKHYKKDLHGLLDPPDHPGGTARLEWWLEKVHSNWSMGLIGLLLVMPLTCLFFSLSFIIGWLSFDDKGVDALVSVSVFFLFFGFF